MFFTQWFFIVLLNLCINPLKCAKILGIFPCPGYSQYLLGERLLGALAKNGHQVTMISAFETKNIKNFKNIIVKTDEQISSDALYDLEEQTIFRNIDLIYEMGKEIVHKVLENRDVQNLIKSNETFDLVINEQFYIEALFVFSAHFNAPLVVLNSMGLNEWNGYLVGNPNPPSYVPTSFSGYTSHIPLLGRMRNSLAYLYDLYKKHFEALPYYEKLIKKHFPKINDFKKIVCNASLLLQNSHVSVTEAVPLTTAVKEIGGFHIKSRPLPEHLKKLLDDAKNGAILLSMGSNLRSADLPEKVFNGILNKLGQLKQKVLWKFENGSIQNLPQNVMISKWLPQSDVLAHPNIVAFISHGGLLSTLESMHYGVPMIGIPIFGDQPTNIARIVKFGAGIHLPLKNLGDDLLVEAVDKIVEDPSFKHNAMMRSNLLRDRLINPLDEAVYWIEYVIRHNGAPHLRNSILELYWYQTYLLDIAGLCAVTIVVICLLVNILLTGCCYKIERKSSTNDKKND